MKRILFYVHFNRDAELDEYVVYQIKKMKPLFTKTIFITNSRVSARDKKRLDGYYDEFIQRENRGFDFGAWRDSLMKFGWENLAKFDELIIMNDTNFGPIYPMDKFFAKFSKNKKVDFWGVSNGIAMKEITNASGHKFSPAEHIHSYFFCFKNNVFMSNAFRDFWKKLRNYEDVNDLIRNGETVFTKILMNAGFKYETIYDSKKHYKKDIVGPEDTTFLIESDKYDPAYTVSRPMQLIEEYSPGYPFIKTKAMIYSFHQFAKIKDFLKNNTNYPPELLDEYIEAHHNYLLAKISKRSHEDADQRKLAYDRLLIAKEQQKTINSQDAIIKNFQKTRTYRVGNVILSPLRIFQRIFKK